MNNRVKELIDLESIMGEINCNTEHYNDYYDLGVGYGDHYCDSHYSDESHHHDSHYSDGTD